MRPLQNHQHQARKRTCKSQRRQGTHPHPELQRPDDG